MFSFTFWNEIDFIAKNIIQNYYFYYLWLGDVIDISRVWHLNQITPNLSNQSLNSSEFPKAKKFAIAMTTVAAPKPETTKCLPILIHLSHCDVHLYKHNTCLGLYSVSKFVILTIGTLKL